MRYAAQAAIERVAPTVVGANEAVRFTAAMLADGGRTMAAAVKQRVHVAFAVANHDHRLRADLSGLKAARLRDFAGMRDPDPGFAENAVQLQAKQRFRVIQRGMHAVMLDQRGNLFTARRGGCGGIDIFYLNEVVTLHVHSPARLRRSDVDPARGVNLRRASALRGG